MDWTGVYKPILTVFNGGNRKSKTLNEYSVGDRILYIENDSDANKIKNGQNTPNWYSRALTGKVTKKYAKGKTGVGYHPEGPYLFIEVYKQNDKNKKNAKSLMLTENDIHRLSSNDRMSFKGGKTRKAKKSRKGTTRRR